MKWKSQIKLSNISTKFGSICFSNFSEKLKSEKQMYEDHNNRPKWWQNFIWNFLSEWANNQRLPGACNRSPGSKLLSITMQLHCGGHLGVKAWLPDTILEKDHRMTIPWKFGSNWATGSRQDGFYVNFP